MIQQLIHSPQFAHSIYPIEQVCLGQKGEERSYFNHTVKQVFPGHGILITI